MTGIRWRVQAVLSLFCVTRASTCVTWQQPASRLQSAVLRNAVRGDVSAHLCSGCGTVWTRGTWRHPYRLHLSSACEITARCSSWHPMPFGARCGSRSLSNCCYSSYFIILHPGMDKFLELTASAKHQTPSLSVFCFLSPDLVPQFPIPQ